MAHNKFQPPWRESPPLPRTYRSIFKWGDPDEYKHPNPGLYKMMKETFALDDSDFQQRFKEGDREVRLKDKTRLNARHLKKLQSICGSENIQTDDYNRAKYSSGKTMEETLELRNGKIPMVTEAVVHPRNRKEIESIVPYCHQNKIPIYVYGGGSSVTLGVTPVRSGITLVLQTYLNRFIELNEINQTATVEAGMMGPRYEEFLNNAPEHLEGNQRYTCGHFPQSFEYSSVGGWVVTLGSGQQSSYYGDAYHLVMNQVYVTPRGTITTEVYPATATGPKLNDIFMGSEGAFGILVEVTLKIFRYMPENRKRFAYMFPSWEATVDFAREVTQGEFGSPSVFRISDPEETSVAMKLYGIEGTPIDTMIRLRGFRDMERCLFIGQADGEASFTKNVKKKVKSIARNHRGMYLTGYPVKKWEHGRFRDPYMREDMQDFGIVIDTLETGVTWDRLHRVHSEVRKYIKKRDQVICMTHSSHFYPQGTNLYFIFIGRFKTTKDYKRFQEGIIDTIERSGGSLSHHHGVGKMIAPWMERHLGKEGMDILRALKQHLDPNDIMNPGGTLGLNISHEKKK